MLKDYTNFSTQLFSYRKRAVFEFLFTSKLIDKINLWQDKASAEYICGQLEWDMEYGYRFLDTLCELDFLRSHKGIYKLCEHTKSFMLSSSKYYQGNAFSFESYLKDSYNTISEVLCGGKRVFNTQEKTNEQYKKDLHNYILAMDNVAVVRAEEVCSEISFPNAGTVLDMASGSGALLFEALSRNKSLQGVYFDLPDVKQIAIDLLGEKIENRIFESEIMNRIYFRGGNVLQDSFESHIAFDIVFISNFIHCYSAERLKDFFISIAKSMKLGAQCVIHDFFKDNKPGLLYDLHMMLNTFEGRTYFSKELVTLCADCNLIFENYIILPSQSSLLVLIKK